MFITKLHHNKTPEKINSTDCRSDYTNGMKMAIGCFRELPGKIKTNDFQYKLSTCYY